MRTMQPKDKQNMDEEFCKADDEQLKHGLPIVSVLVVHNDGAVSTAFWKTVAKHKLQLEGESKADCVKRLRKAAYAVYGKGSGL